MERGQRELAHHSQGGGFSEQKEKAGQVLEVKCTRPSNAGIIDVYDNHCIIVADWVLC